MTRVRMSQQDAAKILARRQALDAVLGICDACEGGYKLPKRFHGLDCPKRQPRSSVEAAAQPKSRATSFRRDRNSSKQPPECPALAEWAIVGYYIGTEKQPGLLRAHGWTCLRLNTGLADYGERGKVRYGEPGMADWLVMRQRVYEEDGRPLPRRWPEVVFLEFKAPGKRPSSAQVAWAEKMRRRGYDVRCVDRIDPLMLEDLL